MQAKHERIPEQSEANWLLFSMHAAEGIEYLLKNFPKPGSEKGCCSSVLWSGTKGNNVPVKHFQDVHIGIVLDPRYVAVPQADLVAFASLGQVVQEQNKEASKYGTKKGYERVGRGFATNLARHEHLPGESKQSLYHDEGSAELFAKNIWRKYHKPKTDKQYSLDKEDYINNGIMKLNEAIVFQKEAINPIAGLLIVDTPLEDTAEDLCNILRNNPNLNLYLYDRTAGEHLVRVLSNQEGIAFFQKRPFFEDTFAQAKPFKGLQPALNENLEKQEKIVHEKPYSQIRNSNSFFAPKQQNFSDEKSNLNREQYQAIKQTILGLEKALASNRPRLNKYKVRKEIKIEALNKLIEYAKTDSLPDAVKKIKEEYPDVVKGRLSHRTADLLDELEHPKPFSPG
ncbi:MAG: hypothetical protein WC785_04095 [Tatlockia sp.]|jgi:hypothetical protein